MDEKELRILIVEDAPAGAELCQRELKRAGLRYAAQRVDTSEEFERALREFAPDLILSDFSMPTGFDGLTALDMVRERSADIPFVFVSGTIGENRAVEAMKRGATDYVLKDHLSRLGSVVHRALRESKDRAARREIERELEETRTRLDNIVSSLRDVVWSYSVRERRLLYVSPAANTIYGRTEASLYANPAVWMDLIHPEDRERVERDRRESLVRRRLESTYRVVLPAGEVRWIHDRGSVATDDKGELVRIDGLARDVTELKLQEQRIARLSRIHAVLSGINSAIVRIRNKQELFDEACRIVVEAGRFPFAWVGIVERDAMQIKPVAWAGAEGGFLSTMHGRLSLDDKTPQGPGPAVRAVMGKKAVVANDIQNDPRILRKKEHLERKIHSLAVLPLLVSDEAVGVLVLNAREIGFFDEEEMKLLFELGGDIAFALQTIEKQEQLDYLSYYDTLTDLPNRTLFIERIGQRMHTRSGELRMVALILLNLERFRNINETLGRQGGDELLKLVARRLESVFKGRDSLARVAADGFGVVMRGIRDAAEVAHAVEDEVLGCFKEVFKLGGTELRAAAKAGIALYPADGGDADTLFRNAEAALKKARDSGERYLFYAADMNARAAQALSLETRLRKAVDAQQFVLHYQPKINLASGAMSGLEALIRWQEPGAGVVAPGTFIPVLEETGLILEAGKWALGRALADYREWTARGCRPPRIAVNVSSIQLQQRNFTDMVVETVQQQGDTPEALELEITESLLMKDVRASIRKLSILRGLGIHVSMDDFGTGYSSLSYIARLPINSLKIDRSFIIGMTDSDQDMAIVTTIIALAHSLNLKVVAEGVETREQASMLKRLKCDEAQGFLFSRPLPPEQIEPLLRAPVLSTPAPAPKVKDKAQTPSARTPKAKPKCRSRRMN